MGLFDIFRRHPGQDPGPAPDGDGPVAGHPLPVGASPGAPLLPVVIRAPGDGDLHRLDDLDLPPGGLLCRDDDPSAPVAWVSEPGDHLELWRQLVTSFPDTGLWPVLDPPAEAGSPLDAEVVAEPGQPGDAEALLRRLTRDGGLDPDRAWRGSWAGLASGTDPGQLTIVVPQRVSRITLVPARRPADVPWRLGWLGPANHDLYGAEVTTVLRSWESRFGAVLTGVGFDLLTLDVTAPPTSAAQRSLLAREHYALCPDNIDQGAGTLAAYADLLRERHWHLWWD